MVLLLRSGRVPLLKVKNEVSAIVLATAILTSTLFASLPLVHADYVVDHASFPPDLPGDLNNDGSVNLKNYYMVCLAFGSSFGDSKWNALCDVNDDGTINLKDTTAVANVFGATYDIPANPIAYSTSFEFSVPNTGVSGVWYYILARIYVPSGLTSYTCFLLGTANAEIQNVIIDTNLTYSSQISGAFNVSLWSLKQGYHLLELEYEGSSGGGSISFNVQTSAGEAMQLDRFRVCVPNYSSATQSYIVATMTNFTYCDRYFIKGFASDCIDNVKFGGGWLYQDWQWELSPNWELNGWGDGFNVPIPWLSSLGPRSIQFRYNATNNGTLDFTVLSFTDQNVTIAHSTPEFWASVMANSAFEQTMSNKTLCAGSHWYGDPGTSERMIIASQQFYLAMYLYVGGPIYWDANIRFDVSIARLDAVLSSETSFAIGLNVTYLGGVLKPADSVRISNVETDVWVPSQALNVVDWEFHDKPPYSKSVLDSDFKIATSMFIAGAVAYALSFSNPVGAVVGTALGTAGTGMLDYFGGTSETPFSYSHTDTEALSSMEYMGSVGIGQSQSEIGFVRVHPVEPNRCGMVRISVEAWLNGADVFTWIYFPVYT